MRRAFVLLAVPLKAAEEAPCVTTQMNLVGGICKLGRCVYARKGRLHF